MEGRVGNPSLKPITQNFAELPQGESRDIAAKAVGWNRETYRQAKAGALGGLIFLPYA